MAKYAFLAHIWDRDVPMNPGKWEIKFQIYFQFWPKSKYRGYNQYGLLLLFLYRNSTGVAKVRLLSNLSHIVALGGFKCNIKSFALWRHIPQHEKGGMDLNCIFSASHVQRFLIRRWCHLDICGRKWTGKCVVLILSCWCNIWKKKELEMTCHFYNKLCQQCQA